MSFFDWIPPPPPPPPKREGRRRAATTRWPPPRPDDESELYLQVNGGGGSWQDWHQNFWLAPLPPAGPSWNSQTITASRSDQASEK